MKWDDVCESFLKSHIAPCICNASNAVSSHHHDGSDHERCQDLLVWEDSVHLYKLLCINWLLSFSHWILIQPRGLVCLCPTLFNSMDCSPPGSSVHGVSQARILEWVAIFYSRGSFQPRRLNLHLVLLHCRWILYHCVTRKAPEAL